MAEKKTEEMDRKYFTHCDCDKCQQMGDVVEAMVQALEAGKQTAKDVGEATPLTFILTSFVDVLRYMFGGDYNGARVASAAAAALKEFIHQEALSQASRADMLELVSPSSGLMGGLGPQVMSMNLGDAPLEVREALESLIARRGGGDKKNYH